MATLQHISVFLQIKLLAPPSDLLQSNVWKSKALNFRELGLLPCYLINQNNSNLGTVKFKWNTNHKTKPGHCTTLLLIN